MDTIRNPFYTWWIQKYKIKQVARFLTRYSNPSIWTFQVQLQIQMQLRSISSSHSEYKSAHIVALQDLNCNNSKGSNYGTKARMQRLPRKHDENTNQYWINRKENYNSQWQLNLKITSQTREIIGERCEYKKYVCYSWTYHV